MTSRTLQATVGIALVTALTACKVGPDYEAPELDTPDTWSVDLSDGETDQTIEPAAWWESFGDDKLDELIALADERNLELRVAASRIVEARAKYGIASADLYPHLSAGALMHWTERPDDDSRISDILPNNNNVAALDMSWELDLFGRVRRGMEAAEADIGATIEDWRQILVTMRAEVASSYIAVRALQREQAILEQDLAYQREMLQLVQRKYDAGTTAEIDLARAQAAVDDLESKLPGIKSKIATSINRMSVIIAEPPGPLRDKLGAPQSVPEPPATIAVGIPADIVRRRPDIRAAERRLAANTARVGVATANLYPRLSIIGSVGFESTSFSEWFDAKNFAAGVGPRFVWPIFSGGAIRAQIEMTDQQTEQALLSYERTVLHAFSEVENALINYVESLAAQRYLEQTVQSRQRIVDLSERRYDAGVDDLETLLDARRRLLGAQRELSMVTGEVATNAVSIYKAIGGGWEISTEGEDPPATEPAAHASISGDAP